MSILIKLDMCTHTESGNKHLYISNNSSFDLFAQNVTLLDIIKTVDNKGYYAETGKFESLYAAFDNEYELIAELIECRNEFTDDDEDELEIIEDLIDEAERLNCNYVYFIYSPNTKHHLKIVNYDLHDGVVVEDLSVIISSMIEQNSYDFCVRFDSMEEFISTAIEIKEDYEQYDDRYQDEIYCCEKIIKIAQAELKL